MSYILDALRKVDRDRSIGEVPGLETAHWGVRRHGRLPRWLWIVAGLLLVNGLLLVILIQDDGAPVMVAEGIAPQPDARPGDTLAIPVPRDPAASGPTVTQRPRLQPRPAVSPAPVRSEPKVQVATAAPAITAEPLSVAGQGSDPAANSRTNPVAAGEYEIPEWSELSLEFRSGFRLPRIDVHVYAENPARRFIMADLKKYREGETMANGALLEKIHPGSIQLEYQGTRFRVDR